MEQKRQETIEALKRLEETANKNDVEGIPLVALHTECALKLAQDALELLTAESKDESKGEPFGRIENGKMYLHTHVGDGKTSAGEKFDICVLGNYQPIVRCGCKTFILSWDDILRLAERAGLFMNDIGENR